MYGTDWSNKEKLNIIAKGLCRLRAHFLYTIWGMPSKEAEVDGFNETSCFRIVLESINKVCVESTAQEGTSFGESVPVENTLAKYLPSASAFWESSTKILPLLSSKDGSWI